MPDMWEAPPDLDIAQAEAYFRGAYVAIKSSKTAQIVAMTKRHTRIRLREVADFSGFLAETADAVRHGCVVVALGDSTTANFSNWAS
ncbi:MAG TPA: hypothetical protein VE993_06430, partial [Stellaceae bacterium]|nr:hypothetical protein [Stellaceae bacterium]